MKLSRSLMPLLAAVTVGWLSSCAPRTAPVAAPVRATVPISSVSFYPQQTGLIWNYVPEDETTRDLPYILRGLGPTIFTGQPVDAMQLSGRGADQTWYRRVDASGVQLLGLRKPGVVVSFSPAWREYPAENAWKVGLVWEGQSAITVANEDSKIQAQGTLKYRYEVQDRRQVKTQAGTFDVWVVTRQITDNVGGLFPATQQLWFTPYVGEIRTPEGLLLTGRNFATKGETR